MKKVKWEIIITIIISLTGLFVSMQALKINELQTTIARNSSLPNIQLEERQAFDELSGKENEFVIEISNLEGRINNYDSQTITFLSCNYLDENGNYYSEEVPVYSYYFVGFLSGKSTGVLEERKTVGNGSKLVQLKNDIIEYSKETNEVLNVEVKTYVKISYVDLLNDKHIVYYSVDLLGTTLLDAEVGENKFNRYDNYLKLIEMDYGIDPNKVSIIYVEELIEKIKNVSMLNEDGSELNNSLTVMEEINWAKLWGTNVIDFVKSFCILIIVFRLISFVVKFFKQAEAMVYFSKALMYGLLVAMISWYIYVSDIGWESLSLFTGFTFLFSATEAIDNLLLWIKHWFDSSLSHKFISLNEKVDIILEEREFIELVTKLTILGGKITPGYVDKSIEDDIVDVFQTYRDKDFNIVESIIENRANGEFNVSQCLNEIFDAKVFRRVIQYNNSRENEENSVIINYYECQELKSLIEKLLMCEQEYKRKKSSLLLEQRNVRCVEILQKHECAKDKFGGFVLNLIYNLKKMR